MISDDGIENLIRLHGFNDFKWIDPHEIVVSQWVRMKCEFGCDNYAKAATCPPNTPSVQECQQFFSEYQHAIVFHFQKAAPDKAERKAWNSRNNLKLIKLENDIFMAGHPKAFLLFMAPCGMCAECVPDRAGCKKPELARPTPEGMAVDVFSTVRRIGYPIEVLTDLTQPMNRYAFLMID